MSFTPLPSGNRAAPDRRLRISFTKAVLSLCGTLLLITVGGCASGSGSSSSLPDWTRYLRASNFPARVEQVIFPSGNVLDGSRSISVGQWTLSFGSDTAIAEYHENLLKHPPHKKIVLQLDCQNEVRGRLGCNMQLTDLVDPRFHPRIGCYVRLGSRWDDYDAEYFDIPCPEKVVFR